MKFLAMHRIERPLSLAAAIVGTILIGIVAVFQLLDALRLSGFRAEPDPLGLAIAAVLIAYVLSVWALISGRFGRWIGPLHTVLAVPVITIAVGVLTTAAAVVVGIGLVGAEAYFGRRRAVAGLRA
jgi:hypothetical protein